MHELAAPASDNAAGVALDRKGNLAAQSDHLGLVQTPPVSLQLHTTEHTEHGSTTVACDTTVAHYCSTLL